MASTILDADRDYLLAEGVPFSLEDYDAGSRLDILLRTTVRSRTGEEEWVSDAVEEHQRVAYSRLRTVLTARYRAGNLRVDGIGRDLDRFVEEVREDAIATFVRRAIADAFCRDLENSYHDDIRARVSRREWDLLATEALESNDGVLFDHPSMTAASLIPFEIRKHLEVLLELSDFSGEDERDA